MDKKVIRISVRNLVEFIFRSGDIDDRKGQGFHKEAMLKGSKLHKKLQKSMGKNYEAEVPLFWSCESEEYILKIEGRADGIENLDDKVKIDEIKGTYGDVSLIEEPLFVHKAQAMCYAFIYAIEYELKEIGVQITYVNLDTEFVKQFEETITKEALSSWFYKLIEEYDRWAMYEILWERTRNQSMMGLEFPFPYREGQRDIVTAVYRTLQQKKQIFIHAPTGIGKTLSTLYPAIRAMGEGYGSKVFYLTAKTITRTVASYGIEILREKGLRLKEIVLTAKDKLCICDSMECNPKTCKYAKGHYDRVNQGVYETLQKYESFTREVILENARKYQVCPFEFSLDLSLWVDGIIGDYNYVFDPNVKLKRYFQEGIKGDYLFLIDEAHNLVERGRQMYSAELSKEQVLYILKEIKVKDKKAKKVIRGLESLNKQLLAYKKECITYQVYADIGLGFQMVTLNLLGVLEGWFEEAKEIQKSEELMQFYFDLRGFLSIMDLMDEHYVIYGRIEKDQDFILKLFCVNPGKNIENCISTGRGAAFFSATLLPLPYYMSLFSQREDHYAMGVSSPFSKKNRLICVGSDVSSKYTRRGFEEYYKICTYIKGITSSKAGNYMIFCPSYTMLEKIKEVYEARFLKEEVIIYQSSFMKEEDREAFLNYFQVDKKTVLAFCVLGGIFSEGIDLIGNRLIGVVIIGTSLPQVHDELEILKSYYEKDGKNGFGYAYRYPGMNKVLQAAGRVIRSVEDKGIICLLDQRFLQSQYQCLFPKEWFPFKISSCNEITGVVKEFWEQQEKY